MRSLLTALLALALAAVALAQPAAPAPAVVTANTILDDLVRRIGGEHVVTYCLIRPGADPHAFEPRPADIRRLVAADLLVVNGLDLEPAVLKLAQNCGFRGPIITASDGIEPRHGACTHAPGHAEHDHDDHGHGAGHGATDEPQHDLDPHAWQSPRAVMTYVANIRDALALARPGHADHYRTRAAALLAELGELETWVREQVATIPAARRKLVTSHDSFGYFADAFGFETVPVAGLSTSAEPDARAVARIIDQIRHEQVPAVFFELTSNPKLVRQIGADAGVRLAEPLYTGSLGEPGSGAETYIGMVRTNVARIVAALR